MFRRLLVGYDGSEGSQRALRARIDLAKELRVDLHLISVEEMPQHVGSEQEVDDARERADDFFAQIDREAQPLARSEGLTLYCAIMAGPEVRTTDDYALDHGFELLVVGFHQHSTLATRTLGNTDEQLLLSAPCSLLVVK